MRLLSYVNMNYGNWKYDWKHMRLLSYVNMNYENCKYDWKHMRLPSYVTMNYGNCKIWLEAYEAAELFEHELWQL